MSISQNEWRLMKFNGVVQDTVYRLNLIMADGEIIKKKKKRVKLNAFLGELLLTSYNKVQIMVAKEPELERSIIEVCLKLKELHWAHLSGELTIDNLKESVKGSDLDWSDLPHNVWVPY